MKVELMAAALALCLASGTAIAQQSITPSQGANMGGSSLIRHCSALSATSDCAIGLRNRSLGGSGLVTSPDNLMNQSSSGLGSTFLRREGAGPLEANEPQDTLSRGIAHGMAGSGEAVGPLGLSSDDLLRHSLSGGGSHGLSGDSLGGGALGGGGDRLR